MSKVEKNRKAYNAEKFRKLLHAKLKSSQNHELGGEFLLQKDNSDVMIYLLYLSFMDEVLKKAKEKSIGPGDEGEITEQRTKLAGKEVTERFKM